MSYDGLMLKRDDFMDRVVAITVSYNDAMYLERCVSALLNQTYMIYRIIIVDNNSNLENESILENLSGDKIDIIRLEENLGGAGGFNVGMRYARERYNPEWYFIMDGDAYPTDTCLERLLFHKNDVKNVGYIAPLIYGDTLGEYQLFHHKKLSKFMDKDIQLVDSIEKMNIVEKIEVNAFVGPLIPRRVVETIGFPDADLFIYGDDLEYTYRISRKFESILVKDAVINHRDQLDKKKSHKPLNWWKDYYMFRNRIMFVDKYQTDPVKRLIGKCLVQTRCFKHVLFDKRETNLRLEIIRKHTLIKGMRDGLRGVSGKTVDPSKYVKMIKDNE